MFFQEILERYISICQSNLENNQRALSFLKRQGISESFIFENFRIGYAEGNLIEILGDNDELGSTLENMGILKQGNEALKSCITIPVFDSNNTVENIVGYNIFPQAKQRIIYLNETGIFNSHFIRNTQDVILTESPIEALFLIQNDIPNVTFANGENQNFIRFFHENRIRRVLFTFEGKARLFFELSKDGISTKRITINFSEINRNNPKGVLEELLKGGNGETLNSDAITEIENGFLFRFSHLSYRVIGNFSEHSMNMKANIKAFTKEEVFVDHAESNTMPSGSLSMLLVARKRKQPPTCFLF